MRKATIALSTLTLTNLAALGLALQARGEVRALSREARSETTAEPRTPAARGPEEAVTQEGLGGKLRTPAAPVPRSEGSKGAMPPPGETGADTGTVAAGSTKDALPTGAELDTEMRALLRHILDPAAGSYGGEEWERFFELARGTGWIEEELERMEARVEGRPDDLDARMELADVYIAKLMTVQGPEQAVWGARAEGQWTAVLDRDPEHWGASFAMGSSLSYYPDVMGKTEDAIGYLETALAVQERGAQLPHHAATYLSLARLYQRRGDHERAREILQAGVEAHAPNAELESALRTVSDTR